jgi:peptidyl-prolyl cis-trans isomerase A (cyclophilin A)
MQSIYRVRGRILAAVFSCMLILPGMANATIVEFQTSMGNFRVNLYDNGTPQTVANFLTYVNNSAYSNSIVHRSALNFVIQGGGFDNSFAAITANAPVVNEPVFSNVRGTISMARPPGGVDTATIQWFINLTNNRAGLDVQNFAVFGEVVDNGMDVVDAIAALPTFPFNSPFGEIPLTNYTIVDFNSQVPIDDTNLVIISAVVIADGTVDSAGAAGLSPLPNTLNDPPPAGPPLTGGGGGGSFELPGLLMLLTAALRRRWFRS